MADLVSTWASKKISLTAQVDHGITRNQKTHPSDIKFRDVKNSEHDVVELMEKAQNHKCSGYCLKISKSNKEDQKK